MPVKYETFTGTPPANDYLALGEIKSTEKRRRKILEVVARQTTSGKLECYWETERMIYIADENLPSQDHPLPFELDLAIGQKFEIGVRDDPGAPAVWDVRVKYQEEVVR